MDLNINLQGEKIRILIMLAILAACAMLTYYFQFILHIGSVYTHFFYIPIFLAAIWWKRWGMIVPVGLAFLLILTHSIIGSLNYPITDDYLRAFMFIFVGLIVTILSERISKSVEMLRGSEEKFSAVVKSAFEGIITIDNEGNIIAWNRGAEYIFGYKSDEVTSRPITLLMPERYVKQYENSRNKFFNRIGERVERIGLKSDGSEFAFEMSLARWYYKDESYYSAIIHDISDRKRAEEELKLANNRLEVLFQEAPDTYFLIDMNGTIVDGNKASEKLTGYKVPELVGKNLLDSGLLLESEIARAGETIKTNLQGRSTGPDEFIIKNKDGKRIYVEIVAVPVNFNDEKLVLGLARDISKRKKAERALKFTQRRLRAVTESAVDGIVTTDTNGNIVLFNNSFENIFGYTKEELFNQSITMLMPERNRSDFIELVENFRKTGEHVLAGKVLETIGLRKDGTEFPFEMSLATWEADGEIYSTSIIRDITERKKSEEQLKKSLKEKEMLLKEIHHRVKNNLMVISSLLNLQSKYIKDKESLNIFRESQNRAQSMALIHERLYRSKDLKRIDFGEYIRTLALDLYHSYVIDPGKIELKFDVEGIMLDINTTIPLGLIVNELVSNSMKHGFPEGRHGEIIIQFHKKDDSTYELEIKDNGVGFPDDLDYRNTESLGLQLVNSLTEQIDGEIELKNSNGTTFTIKFMEGKY